LKITTINIYDTYGKVVRKIENINEHQVKIAKENLAPGVYQFEIVAEKQTAGKGRLIVF
jgi:hypothetical protein